MGKLDQNLKWLHLRGLGKSKIVQSSVFVPLFGYMIIFNVEFAEYFKLYFDKDVSFFRLHFIYFGLVFISLGSLLFVTTCPEIVKDFQSKVEYLSYIRDQATLEYMNKVANDLTDFIERVVVYDCLTSKHIEILNKESRFILKFYEEGPLGKNNGDYSNETFREKWRSFFGFDNMTNVEDIKQHGYMIDLFSYHYDIINSSRIICRRAVLLLYGSGFLLLAVPTLDTFRKVVASLVSFQ